MSSTMKVFLLLAAVVCISKAERNDSGNQCLCQRVRNLITQRSEIKDIQLYPPTVFCDSVEIIVTLNSGLRYCLNPKLKAVKKILANTMILQKIPTVRPTEVTSTPSSI